MPDEIFEKLKSKITPAFAACLLSSFVFGFAAHFYRMTNWLPNWDSLVFREDPQHMESLGRWFLSFTSSLSTDYELPWLCGLICLLFFGLGAAVICKMFGGGEKAFGRSYRCADGHLSRRYLHLYLLLCLRRIRPFLFACLSPEHTSFRKKVLKCRGRRGLCRAVAGNLSGL